MVPANFHFLRPLWFLALLPAGLLLLALWRARIQGSGWKGAINPALLPHLLAGESRGRQQWPLALILAAWLLTCLALAGPAWHKLPQEVRQREDALVLIQDLSLSFYVQDLPPNRLTRARHKLLDILNSRREGLTGMVVYSGDAHVVCPLTDDTATIAAQVSELDPGIMPSYGSDAAAAVELALRLCRDASLSRGRLLLLTDEVEPEAAAAIAKLLRGQNFTLSVIGVGTAAGGPIPKGDNGFLQDGRGNIVIPRLDGLALARLASSCGGAYREISIDDADFSSLLAGGLKLPRAEEYRQVEREIDQWREEGPWLLLLVLPLALLAFRRGWLLGLVFLLLLLPARPSQALEWRDLWWRRDQQAAQALAGGDPATAAKLFQDPQWQGAAAYRAGDFAGAVDGFAKGGSAEAQYNRGNALARLGRYEEALAAYDQALKLDPQLADARVNRQVVERLRREQSSPQNQGQSQKQPGQGQSGQSGPEKNGGDPGQKSAAGQNNRGGSDTPGEKKGDQPGQDSKLGAPGQRPDGQRPESAGGERSGAEQSGLADKGTPGGEKKLPADRLAKGDRNGKAGQGMEAMAASQLSPEQKQELELRLRQVVDNPGGLLRRKFEYQYQRNRQGAAGDGGKIW